VSFHCDAFNAETYESIVDLHFTAGALQLSSILSLGHLTVPLSKLKLGKKTFQKKKGISKANASSPLLVSQIHCVFSSSPQHRHFIDPETGQQLQRTEACLNGFSPVLLTFQLITPRNLNICSPGFSSREFENCPLLSNAFCSRSS
jgi:hypothetical protein